MKTSKQALAPTFLCPMNIHIRFCSENNEVDFIKTESNKCNAWLKYAKCRFAILNTIKTC